MQLYTLITSSLLLAVEIMFSTKMGIYVCVDDDRVIV